MMKQECRLEEDKLQDEKYKRSPLGLIPKEWNTCRMEDVGELFGGYAFKSEDFLNAPTGDSLQVLKMGNIKMGKIDLDNNPAYIKNDILLDKHFKYLLLCGDNLITLTGTIGKTDYGNIAYVEHSNKYLLNQRVACFRDKKIKGKRSYYYYYMQSILFRKKFFLLGVGGTGNQSNVSIKDLNKLIVASPPIAEQKKIASILQTFDKAIELKEKLIEQKKEQRKGLMQKLLTGQIRWNDREKYAEGEIQERNNLLEKGYLPKGFKKAKRFIIPQEWGFVKINKVCQQVSTINKDNKPYVVLSCTKYDGLVDSLKYFDRQVYGSDLSKYRVVSKNEFAYATNHIEEGSIGLLRDYDFGLVSPMYTVFKTQGAINAEFLYALLKTENYRRIYETMMSASVDRRGSLRWNEFSKIEIPLPSLDEQEKIVSIILTAQNEITMLEKELEEVKNQKKGLMQLLLTGKVRVKV